jgi:hypothetical protein
VRAVELLVVDTLPCVALACVDRHPVLVAPDAGKAAPYQQLGDTAGFDWTAEND